MDASKIIDALGGTSAVAGLCKVTTSAVSQWRLCGIPNARMMFLRLARPDAFPDGGNSGESEKKAA